MLYAIEDCIKQHQRQQGYTLHIRHLHIAQGDTLAITGPSGCGKSTMLDILGLALRPDRATCFRLSPQEGAQAQDIMPLWEQNNLDRMAALRLRHMGYVLQTGGLLPFLTVEENMLLTARLNGQSTAEAREAALPLACKLGIEHLLHMQPAGLSVGERQRVAIVRALAPRPRLILADEPTAALDPLHAQKVMDVFLQAVREQNGTLVMVTHDADFALRGGLREVRFDVQEDAQGVRAILDDRHTGAPLGMAVTHIQHKEAQA